MTDPNSVDTSDVDNIRLATSEAELPPDDLTDDDKIDVPAPELDDDETKASDDQDVVLKDALSRRNASQDTDDENLLGLAPGDDND